MHVAHSLSLVTNKAVNGFHFFPSRTSPVQFNVLLHVTCYITLSCLMFNGVQVRALLAYLSSNMRNRYPANLKRLFVTIS